MKDFHAMPHEIIVSDGGSTDKTVEIAKNYADKVVTYEDKKRLDPHLIMFHTGRRAHVIGWPRLLSQWFFNYISMMFFGKSYSKE